MGAVWELRSHSHLFQWCFLRRISQWDCALWPPKYSVPVSMQSPCFVCWAKVRTSPWRRVVRFINHESLHISVLPVQGTQYILFFYRAIIDKEMCTYCRKPLGTDTKMILEALQICCHATCFKVETHWTTAHKKTMHAFVLLRLGIIWAEFDLEKYKKYSGNVKLLWQVSREECGLVSNLGPLHGCLSTPIFPFKLRNTTNMQNHCLKPYYGRGEMIVSSAVRVFRNQADLQLYA